MQKTLLYIVLALVWPLLASCSAKTVEEDVPETLEMKVSVRGEWESLVCSWEDAPDNAAILRFCFGDVEYDIPLTGESGSKTFRNVAEGNHTTSVNCLSYKGNWFELGKNTVRVYGPEYRSSLLNASVSIKSEEGFSAVLAISGPVSDNACSVVLQYENICGDSIADTVSFSGTAIDYKIPSLGGNIVWKTGYVLGESKCYSKEGLLEHGGRVIPEEYCKTVDGYRGIWFSIGQAASEYGPKYSGGLGTYTMKHIPMAIYSPVVDRTYFVYGGAPATNKAYLQ